MPISPTDPAGAAILLVFADEMDMLARWLLLRGGAVVARGGADLLPDDGARVVLAVPGSAVAIHWLALAEGLAPAQAAAAARLMLADASAEPLADMHLAIGRAEEGRTPAALVPARRMAAWLAAAEAAGIAPDAMVPTTMLLAPPETDFVRHGIDHRGPAAAFALEPDLAEAVTGRAPVADRDAAAFEAGLSPLAADPPLDLRQGAFAPRRSWAVGAGALRRLAMLAGLLVLLSLAVPVAALIIAKRGAARMEAEAAALALPGGGADSAPGFAMIAPALFAAIRATPNAELARIDYRADGSLAATVLVDTPATLEMLSQRIRDGGFDVAPGALANRGGRPAAELTVRAR
jgi:general secretion pathway protein L